MTCRLYIDEVGNDDTRTESERYLSLTGIITKVRGHDNSITPAIESLKTRLFGHNPPQYPVILHRKEIIRRDPPFDCLWNEATNRDWEVSLLTLLGTLPYIAITILIDKHEHRDRYKVWLFNPYHYCMMALVERYVLWLRRHSLQGDVVVEQRFKKQDKKLKSAFTYIYNNGTWNISRRIVQTHLTSKEIKFENKKANIAGLQLVEMIANPSHQYLKSKCNGQPMLARFGREIVDVLNEKRYSRDPKTGRIKGWGLKLLP
jgi:Protein of unknown function (DUF3800)